jgi:hypothetical protein
MYQPFNNRIYFLVADVVTNNKDKNTTLSEQFQNPVETFLFSSQLPVLYENKPDK